MFSFIKKLFGLEPAAPAPAAPYKVESPPPPAEHVRVESKPPEPTTAPVPTVNAAVEGVGVVEVPASKPAAMTAKKKTTKKAAAPKTAPATKKPRTRKSPATK